jgi:hypothetical protein
VYIVNNDLETIELCTLWITKQGLKPDHLRTVVDLRKKGYSFKNIYNGLTTRALS